MSFNIRVTPEELRSASNQLQNGNSQIQGILQQLQNQVQQLGEGWAGNAAQEYQRYFAEWQKSAHQLNEALHGLSQLTSAAAQAFETSDQDISKMFKI
jgi:WXG100 family type VII secretion target